MYPGRRGPILDEVLTLCRQAERSGDARLILATCRVVLDADSHNLKLEQLEREGRAAGR